MFGLLPCVGRKIFPDISPLRKPLMLIECAPAICTSLSIMDRLVNNPSELKIPCNGPSGARITHFSTVALSILHLTFGHI